MFLGMEGREFTVHQQRGPNIITTNILSYSLVTPLILQLYCVTGEPNVIELMKPY